MAKEKPIAVATPIEEAADNPNPLNRAMKPGMVRVRALYYIAEEKDDGSIGHYAPKSGTTPADEFDVSESRFRAIAGLVERV
jgi:hypothetical protein